MIPEAFEDVVLHMFHDSLLGAHFGTVNTFYTIRDKFYIHNLFDKIQRYVGACEQCQKSNCKKPKDCIFQPRIPLSYTPMEHCSCDIKYMPKGILGYKFLLVAVCEVTGFTIGVPLMNNTAVQIANALLDKLIFIFGPPKTLIVDEDCALSAKVIFYILDALKISLKIISPHNHGSLKTERYIQTISNNIKKHLEGKGQEWPLYVMPSCYGMNTFVSPRTGFCPYELVFLQKPPDLLNLHFQPLEAVARGYEDYVRLMRAKLENVGNIVTELKTF